MFSIQHKYNQLNMEISYTCCTIIILSTIKFCAKFMIMWTLTIQGLRYGIVIVIKLDLTQCKCKKGKSALDTYASHLHKDFGKDL